MLLIYFIYLLPPFDAFLFSSSLRAEIRHASAATLYFFIDTPLCRLPDAMPPHYCRVAADAADTMPRFVDTADTLRCCYEAALMLSALRDASLMARTLRFDFRYHAAAMPPLTLF